MGNEEGQASTDKGVLILTAMKAVATEHDGSRPVSIAPTGGNIGQVRLRRPATCRATTTWTPPPTRSTKPTRQSRDGHGDR